MLVISEGQTVQYADHFEAQVAESPMQNRIRFEVFADETHASLYRELINENEPSPARTMMLAFIDEQLAQQR